LKSDQGCVESRGLPRAFLIFFHCNTLAEADTFDQPDSGCLNLGHRRTVCSLQTLEFAGVRTARTLLCLGA
jgi:hypothetical protein